MKTLAKIKSTVSGGKLTLTADIIEKDYSGFPVQQQTIVHISKQNRGHHRHMQMSQAGVVARTPGKNLGFVLEKQDFIDLATSVEPRLSYAPVASKLGTTLTVNISSELKADLQWQVSADKGKTWADIAGQTTNTLDKTTVKAGQLVRLKASSEAGEMISNSTIV